MRITTTLALLAATLTAAQTTTNAPPTSTGKSCDAQNILDTCKSGIQKQIDTCKGNDWMCLCDNYTNLLTCYNNCPDDLGKSPVQNQVTQFCAAAAPLSSASASVAATAIKAKTSATSATATASDSSSATATPFDTGAAAGGVVAPIGGVFAVLLGVAGML